MMLDLKKPILFILILISLSSCAGYHYKDRGNPFSQYGIKSVAIPMFLNDSLISNISAPITKQIYGTLAQYPDLQLSSGEPDKPVDAVLIGIITSSDHRNDVYHSQSKVFTQGELQDSIGARPEFYMPLTVKYKVTLRVVLIKDPSLMDRKLLVSKIGKYLKHHPKVVFDEPLTLTSSYSLSISENTSPDSGGVVNFTKSRGVFEESLQTLSKTAAQNFKETILDAF